VAPAHRVTRLFALALAIATGLGASAVRAQDTDTTPATAVILTPLSLVNDADMIFGNIVQPTAAGTVVLTPLPTATCTTTGGLIRTGTCQAAGFVGWGSVNQTFRINMPNLPIVISNGAQTMNITNRTFDVTDLVLVNGNPNGNGSVRYRITRADGIFRFRIGGTLDVAANQALGLYTGSFNVTISYE
jgi:hypothetical protein